jgi:pyruvate formate lyase activating enzyme
MENTKESVIQGTVFNIQRFSLDDGPGIRTLVFLKGCPLRCLWCSNPESQNAEPELAHRDTVCTKCGRCINVCDTKAISINDKGIIIDRKLCTNCGQCTKVCLPEALKIFGKIMSVEEVLKEINKDSHYYQKSGGGVTISGGEPLCQPEFTAALLKQCQNQGIHTAIETSGYGDTAALEEIIKHTNLVLFDIKSADINAHQQLTSRSNELILRNLKLLLTKDVFLIVRIPVIPGYNDSDRDILAMADKIAELDRSKEVNLLPYHRFGMAKYHQLDREYKLKDLIPPTKEQLEKAKDIMKSSGLNCKIVLG